MSPQWDVTLLARHRVLHPGELRCICATIECYRRQHTTVDDDGRQRAKQYWPPTLRVAWRLSGKSGKALNLRLTGPNSIPSLSAFTQHRSTQPCIPLGSLNRVPASAGGKRGDSHLCQVAGLRYHCVIPYGIRVSRNGVAEFPQTAIHLLHLFTFTMCRRASNDLQCIIFVLIITDMLILLKKLHPL